MELRKQDGVVAMVTAIVVSLFIMVITTSAVVLMVGELRQAIDAENSVRAYYAAESGAEDAVQKIKTKIEAINAGSTTEHLTDLDLGCQTAVLDAGTDSSYSCQKILTLTTTPQGKLQREEPLQYDLTGNGTVGFNQPPTRIEVSWNQADCSDCDSVSVPFATPAGLPQPAAWTAPALMEVGFVRYPKTGAINQASIVVSTVVLKPNSPSGASGAPPAGYPPSVNWQPTSSPTSVNCYRQVPQNDYNCRAYITGLSGSTFNYVVRVRPRYLGTSYRLRFYNGTTQIGDIPDQYATVDVTGRAGDVYRRIVQRVKIRSGAFAGLDYVLYGDQSICKDFTVDGTTYTPGTCGY